MLVTPSCSVHYSKVYCNFINFYSICEFYEEMLIEIPNLISFLLTCLQLSFGILFVHQSFVFRWLNTVFHKMEYSRFRLVFLDCYFLISNKEYRNDVKHRPKGSNLFTEATQLSLLWQR